MAESRDDAPPRGPAPEAAATPDPRRAPAEEVAEPLPGGAIAPELAPHGDALTGPAAEGAAERALAEGGARLAPVRLLSFYDRLRRRVAGTLERRGGRTGRGVADALLLVPDVFLLLLRLALDPAVPRRTRTLIGGALAYFVLPIDLLPEALVGVGGFLDDLVLAVAVLTHAMSDELEERVRRHWSGSDDVRRVLHDVATTAHSLLGEDLFGRLRALLARRGIVLEAQRRRPLELDVDDEELGASADVGRSPYH